MKMTLARALKYKKRVIERINKLSEKIKTTNSYLVVNGPVAATAVLLEDRNRLVEHLMAVKLAIVTGNRPIEAKIMLIPEPKGRIAFLKGIDTKTGKEMYGYREGSVEYAAQISQVQVDDMVAETEKWIDKTQEEIDKHNYSHEVTIPDNDFDIW